MKIKNTHYYFFRGIYGGCHWIPFVYWTKAYKEMGWLLWVFTIATSMEEDDE